MNIKFYLFLLTFVITISHSILGQVSTSNSRLRIIKPEDGSGEKINKVITEAGESFKAGLTNLQENRKPKARASFDKSVEVFLLLDVLDVNIRSNAKLLGCYNRLIETVYRMEFPSERQPPQINDLALTCGWNIDQTTADNIAKLVLNDLKNQTSVVTTGASVTNKNPIQTASPIAPKINSSDQIFDECNKSALQNIRLGMTIGEVEKVFNKKLQLKTDRVGTIDLGFRSIIRTPENNSILLRFYNSKVYEIDVSYNDSIKWNDFDEFTTTVANNLHLPNKWKKSESSIYSDTATIYCKKSMLVAIRSLTGNFSLILKDMVVIEKMLDDWTERVTRAVEEEKKRKTRFKP